jgi:hypothetical protein
MAIDTWSPGHIQGKAMGVDLAVKNLRALFEVMKAATYQEEFSDEEEVNSALLLLVRLGFKECDDIAAEVGKILNLVREQEQRERAAHTKEG